MRLVNAATLELERFDDDNKIPPYTILSHTWRHEEVSLEEFRATYASDADTQTRVKSMSGYGKITKTCAQTLLDGYAYAWVDTCEWSLRHRINTL